MNETTPTAPTLTLEQRDRERLSATRSEAQLQRDYLGVYPDREALGQRLFASTRAHEHARLALPRWLADYVRLDGTAYVVELESAGLFVIEEVSNGICVFDGTPSNPPKFPLPPGLEVG